MWNVLGFVRWARPSVYSDDTIKHPEVQAAACKGLRLDRLAQHELESDLTIDLSR